MPTKNPLYFPADHKFKYFDLTDEQIAQGSMFTVQNLQVIQNQISYHAHEHLNISYSDQHPSKAAIEAAYCKGAIEALTHLVDSHNAVTGDAVADPE